MPSLAESQSRFIACLQKGPEHLPVELFTESPDRAILGMQAHANTVSHARLVALENTYPKLYEHMGHEPFHTISRDYIDQPHILTCDLNDIGAGFADFLEQQTCGKSEIDLARIEWAWIESFHSAEAAALALNDIATLGEESLLALQISPHPAIRLVQLSGPLSPQLSELGEEAPFSLMTARPDSQVLFYPLEPTDHALVEKFANISTMGNLLAAAIELGDEATAMERTIKLIQAGAIEKI